MKPIIRHFRATNIWHAFILNAFAVALTSTIAVEAKRQLDKSQFFKKYREYVRFLVTLLIVFVAASLTYSFLHIFFGYGGGMLVNT